MNTAVARKRRILMLGLPAVLLGAGLVAWGLSGRTVGTDNAYARAVTVDILPEVPGRIVALPVRANQPVRKGDLLLAIEPADYELAVREAQAEVYVQMARVEALRPEMRAMLEKKRKAMAEADYYTREAARLEGLHARQAVTEAQLDDVRHRRDAALAEVQAFEQEYRQVGTGLGNNINLPLEKHPFYTAAVARLEKARLDLARTRITAPMDGVVTNKQANPGDMAMPGRTALSLVQDSGLWVEANLKETELTHVAPGQPVTVDFDVYPGVEYRGEVESIAPATGAEFALLPPQNASGNWVKVVQRIPVRIRVDMQPGQPPLRAGLSAQVHIDTGRNHLQRLLD